MDKRIRTLSDTPHTLSYVIRKRQQIDSLSELPEDKRPTDEILWDGSPEDLDEWLKNVMDSKYKSTVTGIDVSEVE